MKLTYLALLERFVNPPQMLSQGRIVIVLYAVVWPTLLTKVLHKDPLYVTGESDRLYYIIKHQLLYRELRSWKKILDLRTLIEKLKTYLPCNNLAISAHLLPNFLWASNMIFSSALVIGSLLISGSKWLCHLNMWY